jgi:D-alanyl-D-alanine carboxypeptidase
MQEESDRPFRLLSYDDDQPTERPGSLIPRPKQELTTGADNNFHPFGVKPTFNVVPVVGFGFGAVALFLLAIIGTTGYGLVAQSNLASAPTVSIVDPYTQQRSTLSYGPQTALEEVSVFTETRDAFIDEGTTFVELDVSANQLRFFKRGVLLISAEVQSLGKPGSWWSVPAGLYEVEALEDRPYSNMAQAYFPHAVRFGGNYLIHGAPEYPDKTVAPLESRVGGVRLSNESATHLYSVLAPGMPVLVHTPPATPDAFIYQPAVPGVGAPQYLVADVNNGTILATKGINEPVPIASIVKLMTAVVASEEIDLDTRVRANAPSFVESLIPRLADRSSVSMYSLLQLLLVESSNEASEVIASQLGRETFIDRMNEKGKQIGMYDSVFADPSGLDAGNISTVGDLYTLVRYIHEQRSFIFDITDTTRVSTDSQGGEFGTLVNFNRIEDIDSFVGGKVGETNAAGQTSVSLHQLEIQGEERLVVVIVLGSSERSKDVATLLAHVDQVFSD